MTFTTLTFLIFFVCVFFLYWALPGRRSQNWLIVVASYVFYGWWDYRFCGLLLFSSLLDYSVGRGLESTPSPQRRRVLLWTSVTANLGLLGFFKYANFFVDSAVQLATSLGWQASPATMNIILPVGISFYTFQTMSYTIDVYRRHLPATRDLGAYLAYVSFFPQLVAGPIERGTRLLPQFLADRRFDPDAARDGLRQMLWGFMKKLVVADRLGVIVDFAYARWESATSETLLFATLCFAFQVYYDFSAYSDIAIGCGRLFGIDLMRNFAYPFFSQSVSEFWRRWHISFTTWLRDYLYIPLGGGRVGRAKSVRNVMLTFIAGGLWHGAGLNFICWGAINGALVSAEMLAGVPSQRLGPRDTPGGERWVPSAKSILLMLWSFTTFMLGMSFFRAESLAAALHVLPAIVQANPVHMVFALLHETQRVTMGLLAGFLLLEWAQRRHAHPLQLGVFPRPMRWLLYSVAIWSTIALMPQRPNAFIYFQF